MLVHQILSESLKKNIETNIFSALEVVNKQLVGHMFIDSISFFDTFVSVAVGTTSKANCVTSVEIMSLCRRISDIFLHLGVITHSSCRFIAVDFDDCIISLAIDL